MTGQSETRRLIEEAMTAWRPKTPAGALLPHPAWADLDLAAREKLADETMILRAMERALDPQGYSTTVRAVLARLRGV